MARKAAPTTRQAGPVDPSRGSGPRVPDSAASTSPPPMYDPDDGMGDAGVDDADLGAAGVGGQFLSDVREQADRFEGQDISADREITEGAAADATDAGPSRDEISRIRSMRRPLGSMSQKLALPARRGYHRHWFNDTAGRIEEAQAAGWAFVKGNDGKNIKRCVGTGRDRNALWAYAMELPLVFWQEDQSTKNAAADAVMDGLKNQPFRAERGSMTTADRGKFYDPSESGPLHIAKH
jgi:hypothetical protein